MTKSTIATLALLGSSLVVAACGGTASTIATDTAEAAIDSSDSTQSEGDVMMASFDGAAVSNFTAPTGAGVAAAIAANITARFPGGCAVATASGANVTVTYSDCTGPRGLVHVTGELDLAISLAAGEIDVHATASNFEVNGAVLDIDATGAFSRDGANSKLVVSSHGTGVGPRGNAIDHQGNYTIEWDPSTLCHSINGTWSTDFSNANGSRQRSNQVDLERCPGACPTGSLTHTFLTGASLTVTFDGTNVAQWTASTGRSGSVNLTCGQ